jgi:integrase
MEWAMRMLLKLSLVTGHRISEIAGMRRDELRNLDEADKAEWHVPAKRMKHKLPHITPLSPLALRLIKKALKRSDHAELILPGRPGRANENGERVVKPYGKSAPSHAMRRAQGLNEKGERDGAYQDVYGFAEPVVPHDLRRTLGTGFGALKYSRFIQDRVLAHKDNTIGGVYDRHAYLDEKREALEAWADHLAGIIYRARRKPALIIRQQMTPARPARASSPWART